jgi:transcriptional regulator with XRE-family HTH domain
MSKSLSKRAADRLRDAMGEAGVNSAELARRLERSEVYVWRRVHGITSLSMAEIERIAAALDVPAERLLPPTEVAA